MSSSKISLILFAIIFLTNSIMLASSRSFLSAKLYETKMFSPDRTLTERLVLRFLQSYAKKIQHNEITDKEREALEWALQYILVFKEFFLQKFTFPIVKRIELRVKNVLLALLCQILAKIQIYFERKF